MKATYQKPTAEAPCIAVENILTDSGESGSGETGGFGGGGVITTPEDFFD